MAASTWQPGQHPALDTHMSVAVFCVGFAVFLVIALIAQVLFVRWRAWLPGAEGEGSLIGGVKSAVFTFMSYIP